MSFMRARIVKTMMLVMVMAMVFTIVSPLLADQALAASSRAASVVEVEGTAYLKKAGGTKKFRLFKKMTINQGDTIITEKDSSVILNVIDREDEVTIGENSEIYMSDLLEDDGATTGMKVWAGSAYSKVSKLGSSDTYKIDTPNATMGVRGTHFYLAYNPHTGISTLILSSGIIEARTQGNNDGQTTNGPTQQVDIYPSMQLAVIDPSRDSGQLNPELYITPIDDLITDPAIIAALIRNKQQIDEENEEMLERLRDGEQVPEQVADMDAYRQNVENAIHHVLNQALNSGQLSEERLQEIIDQVNNSTGQDNRRFDLNREVPPINPNAMTEEMRRQREIAEQRKKQQEQQRRERQQQMEDNNRQLLERIQQQQEELARKNQEAAEQKQQEALDRMLEKLGEEDRERFLQNRQDALRGQTRDREESPQPSNPGSDPTNNDPTAQLVIREQDDESWTLDVELMNIPAGFYGAQLHVLFNAEHFATIEDEDGAVMLDTSELGELFTDAVFHANRAIGEYTWDDGQTTATTEIVFAVTSTGDVTNGPIRDRVWFSIPLKLTHEQVTAAGSILLKELRFVDQEGQPLPIDVTKIHLPYEFE